MAKDAKSSNANVDENSAAREVTKLPALPKGARVHKRPLLRPPIPSPYAGRQQQKVVYISAKTPFMSAFKRIKKLLDHVEKRDVQSILARQKKRGRRALSDTSIELDSPPEPVVAKASGKAIEKALSLALFLQEQPRYAVQIKTTSVDAVDDIVAAEVEEGQVEDLPDSRIRHANMVEVWVTLR